MTTALNSRSRPALCTPGRLRRKRPFDGLPQGCHLHSQSGLVQYDLSPTVRRQIEAHSLSNTGAEMAGILLGRVYRERDAYLTEVTAALPARFTASGPAHVTFTGATWLDILSRRPTFPGLMTVGWYHSHPGIGVFLSGSDLYIHRSFFGDQPWYIAVVVDPIAQEWGIFGWRDDCIVRLPNLPAQPVLPEDSK